jgi:toxin ParE1/3/4
MTVLFSPQATQDLRSINRYIARTNPSRAATFTAELVAACEHLADMPKAWPLVPRYEYSGYRRRPYKNYLIFYELVAPDDTVAILHVLHGSRDCERLLFPSD